MTRTRTERLTEFQGADAAMAALQRVLLIGKDYAVRKSQAVAQYNPAGISATWPGLLTGESVETSSATVLVENAVLPILRESVATPTAANGAIVGVDATRIWHNSGSTVWLGSGRTVTTDVFVGDLVILVNGATSFSTSVLAIEYNGTTSGKVLVLSNTVPAGLASGYFNVTVAEVASRYVPATALTLTGSTVAVAASLQLASLRLGATPVSVIAAVDRAGTLLSRVVVNYRATRTTSTVMTATQVVTLAAQLDGLFIGHQYPESELGFAVAQSIPPIGSFSIAPAVLCRAPTTYDDAGFTAAITAVTADATFSVVCPMSQSATVITAARNMVATRAAVSGRKHTHVVVSKPIVSGASADSEVAAFIAAAAFNDENTVVVFPPSVAYSGLPVADTTAVAIVACLRGCVAHGLSLVGTAFNSGFTHVAPYSVYNSFSAQLAAGGVTVIAGAEVLHSRTTKLSNNLALEEGMVALKNVVRRRLFQSVESLIAAHRVTVATLELARSEMRAVAATMVLPVYEKAGKPLLLVTVGVPTINALVPSTIDIPVTAYVSTTWFTGLIDVSITVQGA